MHTICSINTECTWDIRGRGVIKQMFDFTESTLAKEWYVLLHTYTALHFKLFQLGGPFVLSLSLCSCRVQQGCVNKSDTLNLNGLPGFLCFKTTELHNQRTLEVFQHFSIPFCQSTFSTLLFRRSRRSRSPSVEEGLYLLPKTAPERLDGGLDVHWT